MLPLVLEKQNYVSIPIALSMSTIHHGTKIVNISDPHHHLQYGLLDTKDQYTAYSHSTAPKCFRLYHPQQEQFFSQTYDSDIIFLQFNPFPECVALFLMV